MVNVSEPKTYHVVKVQNKTKNEVYIMNYRLKPKVTHYFFVDPNYLGRFLSIKNRVHGLVIKPTKTLISRNSLINNKMVMLIDPYDEANIKHLLGYGDVEYVKQNGKPAPALEAETRDDEGNILPLINPEDIGDESDNNSDINPATADEMRGIMDGGQDEDTEKDNMIEELLSKSISELKDAFRGKINFGRTKNKSKMIKKIVDFLDENEDLSELDGEE